MFVEKVRKYGLMPTSVTGESKLPVILLIDDLPMTNGKAALERLKECLHLLVCSTQIPTAILVTDYGNTDSADHNIRGLEELQLYLENAGACKVTSLKVSQGIFMSCFVRYLCQAYLVKFSGCIQSHYDQFY